MTSHIILVVAFACTIATARAVDINKLPPINETKLSADVELRGREIEAIEVAFRQFRADHFSTSGDLRHFRIQLTRERGKLFVAFLPDLDERTERITPARNKYGTAIHYAISLRTLRIIGYHYERD